jgi:hypothetical protein
MFVSQKCYQHALAYFDCRTYHVPGYEPDGSMTSSHLSSCVWNSQEGV